MSAKDYYKTLGLLKEASDDEIKKAYRALAMKYHPDKTEELNKDNAAEKFKEVSEAYQVLSDPEKKRQYDMGGIPQQPIFGNPFELFTRLFGANNGFPSNSKFQFHVFDPMSIIPEPIISIITCTIFDIFNGATRELKYTKHTPLGEKESIVEVNIQKGWKDGTRLTYHGHGHQFHVNGKYGDLIVIIKEKNPGPNLARLDNDLIFTHIISLKSALLGFDFNITNLDGERITIDLKGTIVPDGSEKRLIGKGIDGKNKTGDLIIRFKVEYPTELTTEQREFIEKSF